MAAPFWIAGAGIICSIVGIYMVRTSEEGNTSASGKVDDTELLESLLKTIRKGIFVAAFLVIGASAAICHVLLSGYGERLEWRVFGCICIGLVSGETIGMFTEYCTSYTFNPTQSIARKSDTGPATVIIQGLGVGMISCVVPALTLVVAILLCNSFAGLYGISIAAVGMLSTLGVTLATDAYGPVADNAGGIAEMVEDIQEVVRERTDALDALGNTTAATGKGFAIGSAVLTSAGLIAAFMDQAGLSNSAVDIKQPVVLCGVLIGAMLPFLFAALTMLSVGKAAEMIIVEVRDQFYRAPGIMTGAVKPDYDRCIRISTEAALKEMMLPGVLAVFTPAVVGFLMGSYGLAGMLAGALTSGFMLAVMMANAGGAWDNAKKYVEKDGLGAGRGKHTSNHDATVIGDTVGDPFKDTSGPSLNILIKLMSVVSLVLAPVFKSLDDPNGFDNKGTTAAIITATVVGVVAYVMHNKFERGYAEAQAEVEARKRVYDASVARNGGDSRAVAAAAADAPVAAVAATPAAVVVETRAAAPSTPARVPSDTRLASMPTTPAALLGRSTSDVAITEV